MVEQVMSKLCRNGHDLSVHGRIKNATKTRAAHIRCQECRRLCRQRENEIAKRNRLADRPPANTCRNGHDRERSRQVSDVGGRTYWRCLECDRMRAEIKRAVERNR